ncbi:MAG: hypothetical protein KAI17_03260 [Thiotrichaceae bacterium]|nr:hypothetical protein [Thiotrichaceae bacterium]
MPEAATAPEASPAPAFANVFEAAHSSAVETPTPDAPQASEPESGFTPVDLSKREFKDPTTDEEARTQLGRIKEHMAELKTEIRHHRDSKVVPDSYEVTLDQNLTDNNMKVDEKNPMYASFKEIAPELGLNQDQFNKIVNLYLGNELSGFNEFKRKTQEKINDALVDLGGNNRQAGQNQLRAVSSQLKELGVSEGQINSLQNSISGSVDAMKGLQHVLGAIGYQQMAQHTAPPTNIKDDYAKVEAEMGSDQYQDSKNEGYRKEVNKRLHEVFVKADKYKIAFK